MQPLSDLTDIRESYRLYAVEMSTSPCYQAWASGAAGDPEVLRLLSDLPTLKQQANLVFAAARRHGLQPGPYDSLRALLLGPEWPAVRETILSRRTQTNEVARLTALTPALGMLGPEPLALVELGASAGLCLYPDRYDYLWEGAGELRGSGGPMLRIPAVGPVPVPAVHPRITARIGVDLHPLDVAAEEDMDWLLTLIWPGHDERRDRLAAAIEVTRAEPPRLIAGDMLDRLDSALEIAAASGGTPVVHHSAAAAYLDEDDRVELDRRMRTLVAAGRCHWVSLEGPRVMPSLAPSPPSVPDAAHHFCLAVDGRPVGWFQGHGAALRWNVRTAG
ncbi:DUF2332 domain-containing protein [Nocardioides albus]|uniref:DUF2332 domain-containing protein n=1 Tax=Nocardioides albus TaxID=1841 RepID=A0A7W5A1T1_9ACTN|nr:DUF2332 domain-containing protein [Nocardioides albus]MBB3087945.1 hypothetical protein [Nocardioides albus]GGU21493.1 hypothetical protein GCM10007979_20120 [Nocardioides albus]